MVRVAQFLCFTLCNITNIMQNDANEIYSKRNSLIFLMHCIVADLQDNYLGCFKDNETRDMPVTALSRDMNLTIAKCVNICKEKVCIFLATD